MISFLFRPISLKCKKCTKKFKNVNDRSAHERDCCRTCRVCKKIFTTKAYAETHELTKHK